MIKTVQVRKEIANRPEEGDLIHCVQPDRASFSVGDPACGKSMEPLHCSRLPRSPRRRLFGKIVPEIGNSWAPQTVANRFSMVVSHLYE